MHDEHEQDGNTPNERRLTEMAMLSMALQEVLNMGFALNAVTNGDSEDEGVTLGLTDRNSGVRLTGKEFMMLMTGGALLGKLAMLVGKIAEEMGEPMFKEVSDRVVDQARLACLKVDQMLGAAVGDNELGLTPEQLEQLREVRAEYGFPTQYDGEPQLTDEEQRVRDEGLSEEGQEELSSFLDGLLKPDDPQPEGA